MQPGFTRLIHQGVIAECDHQRDQADQHRSAFFPPIRRDREGEQAQRQRRERQRQAGLELERQALRVDLNRASETAQIAGCQFVERQLVVAAGDRFGHPARGRQLTEPLVCSRHEQRDEHECGGGAADAE